MNEKKNVYVYAVTYWYDGEEPVITVWDNEPMAKKHCEYISTKQEGCSVIMDKCRVFSTFKESN